MVIKNNNKKGAVELSLNLIIMLIIGMVVLGLVISFVTKLVGAGVDSFDNQIGDNEKLKLDGVRNCPENLCIAPSPTITVKKGEKTNVFIKVRAYNGIINCPPGEINNNCAGNGEGDLMYSLYEEDGTEYDASHTLLTLAGPGLTAEEGAEDAKMYTLKADGTVPQGIYYMKLELYSQDPDNKISETLTVEVE